MFMHSHHACNYNLRACLRGELGATHAITVVEQLFQSCGANKDILPFLWREGRCDTLRRRMRMAPQESFRAREEQKMWRERERES